MSGNVGSHFVTFPNKTETVLEFVDKYEEDATKRIGREMKNENTSSHFVVNHLYCC